MNFDTKKLRRQKVVYSSSDSSWKTLFELFGVAVWVVLVLLGLLLAIERGFGKYYDFGVKVDRKEKLTNAKTYVRTCKMNEVVPQEGRSYWVISMKGESGEESTVDNVKGKRIVSRKGAWKVCEKFLSDKHGR